MPEPDTKRNLEALIKATEENRTEQRKTQQKMDTLEAAIQALKNSKLESCESGETEIRNESFKTGRPPEKPPQKK